jgi:hypothetical protein
MGDAPSPILTLEDTTIDALSADARRELAGVWQHRGSHELHVASGFAALANDLYASGAPQKVHEAIAKALRDEVRHAELSILLAARYRGDEPVWPDPIDVEIPTFPPSSGALKVALTVISLCCINETLACGALEAALRQCEAPVVRLVLREILEDEVEHARAGWSYLASPFVSNETRRVMGPWLKRLCAAKIGTLAGPGMPLPGESFPAQGLLSRRTTQQMLLSTLREVVLPGWERAGFDVRPVTLWMNDAFAAVESAD